MAFQKNRFKKFAYKRLPYVSGIQIQCEFKQNGRKVDFIAINDKSTFRNFIKIAEKYGFKDQSNDDIKEEINELNKLYL